MTRKKQYNISNKFGDRNYQMKESYEADNLVVAKFQRISGGCIEFGPAVETTEQKYIFELVQKGNKIRYREIFTGFITSNVNDTVEDEVDCMYFNLPYILEPEEFTKYFPQTKGRTLPKLSLIWTLNDVNYPKEKENVKTKNK